MPQVRIQDNLQLPANTYVVRIKEIEVGSSDIRPNRLLVMDSSGNPIDLPGTDTLEPTFGLPAMWVDPENREEATFKGYTVCLLYTSPSPRDQRGSGVPASG